METIGMVGVGASGRALLERLRLKGEAVAAYDSSEESREAARALGADVVSTAAEVAKRSTIVDVVVRDDQQVLDCMTGKNGIIEGARKGGLVLLHSTILPSTTHKVADLAARRGVDVIDACMIGVPKSVREGKLTFIVGGADTLVQRATPHLLKMARQVFHMGPRGAGNAAKLIKNLTTGAEILIFYQALRIGEAAGVHYRDALEMMRKSYAGPLLDHWRDSFDESGSGPKPIMTKNGTIFEKDIPLAGALAREYGLDLPLADALVAEALRVRR